MAEGSARPRVICHMGSSLDGRIVPEAWPLAQELGEHYEAIHKSYKAQGWLCGRITMEEFAGKTRTPKQAAGDTPATDPRDHVVPKAKAPYAFAMDASGRLDWQTNDIRGDHVVAVLTEKVGERYLTSLRERGVSYIFAGKKELDPGVALQKIKSLFGVKTLMLEGGGKINGGLLQAGLVDEVSLLLLPVVDSREGTPALFDADPDEARPWGLRLREVEKKPSGILWLRYDVESSAT